MKTKHSKHARHMAKAAALMSGVLLLSACGAAGSVTDTSDGTVTESEVESTQAADASANDDALTKVSAQVSGETYSDDTDGGHAIEVDGETANYKDITVTKTGEADGDEADFYGENAAVFATNGATLTIENADITTDGTHANAVFSYGEGTTVTISDSTIQTSGNCSGGLMTTGGGTMNAENLTITTSGNSSAAIRSDRGGGTVTVTGGSYTTSGVGSPAIYSTADITVNDAALTSTASQGVVVEGNNSVTLVDCDLTADNNQKNGNHSDTYQAVMIYQSMSGDAAEGDAYFEMEGGTLTNKNGDLFFVNNTIADIKLTDVDLVNEDTAGLLLRAEAAGWGNEGENGGQLNLYASDQALSGDIHVDDVSILNLYLKDESSYEGAINTDGDEGDVYVEIESGASWKLTGDSYITALTCDADAIDLNGHSLYIDGKAYAAGTASTGEAIAFNERSAAGGPGGSAPGGDMPNGEAPSGNPPEMPNGEAPSGNPPEMPNGEAPSGTPPEMPNGEAPSGNPPEMPSGEAPSGNPPAMPGQESSDSSSSTQA